MKNIYRLLCRFIVVVFHCVVFLAGFPLLGNFNPENPGNRPGAEYTEDETREEESKGIAPQDDSDPMEDIIVY